MGPGSLFGRVLQWLANEVIVKSLANNPAFQRFAVRSSQQAKEITKTASQAVRNIADNENVSQFKRVLYLSSSHLPFLFVRLFVCSFVVRTY